MKTFASFLIGLMVVVSQISARANCTLTNLGLTPLPDMGFNLYRGYSGGLYPNGANNPPPQHLSAGLNIALNEIVPLDSAGHADETNGKVVMISVGMSNTTQEFAIGSNDGIDAGGAFKPRANGDPAKHPQLLIVDGAQGGQDVTRWTNLTSTTWKTVNSRLTQAGVTSNQVQVAWVKHSLQNILQYGRFPTYVDLLQEHLEIVVRNLKILYPNIKIVYVSSRTRAYTDSPSATNPEPASYEVGFATKWMIEKQINGDLSLNFDSAKGEVVAPWLSWGPYFWADGLNPRRSDGFIWACSDFLTDFTHPSNTGVRKAADQLLAFFKTDPTATPWFLKKTVVGQPPNCAVFADVSNGVIPLTVSFSAHANDADGTIRDYQWTFDDGTFATNANPTKTFKTPGVYTARVTVTDNDGNNVSRSTQISVAAVALSRPLIVGDEFQFAVLGATNYNYVVQRSDNLTNWFPVITNRGAFTFTSTNSGSSSFYRAVLEP
ncbi:MAG: PKD domain-containing protein [Verrucomicrobia bacterium]|nr:PKD domain-containing protein [Verrucomicrobiota bacterium]